MTDPEAINAQRYQWRTELLQDPNLSSRDAHAFLVELGRARYLPARPVIEQLLTNPDSIIREKALIVLAGYFDLPDYWETARQFMWDDPDPSCRGIGIDMLGFLKRSTNDARTLAELARLVRNPVEDAALRGRAYKKMLQVRHLDRPQQWDLVGKGIDEIPDVDWAWGDQCIQNAPAV